MLVAIEGIDGTGKATQTQLLVRRARAEGLRAACLSFPRYGETVAAQAVRAYLDGAFGSLEQVDPQLAGLLFALDRFESRALIAELRADHDLVVLDRYTGSNVAHQVSRAPRERRAELRDWLQRVERDVFGLPAADLTLLLDLDPAHADAAVHRRATATEEQAPDLHERDGAYLRACREVYRELARDPSWTLVACERQDGSRLAPNEVAEAAWAAVSAARERQLGAAPPAPPPSARSM